MSEYLILLSLFGVPSLWLFSHIVASVNRLIPHVVFLSIPSIFPTHFPFSLRWWCRLFIRTGQEYTNHFLVILCAMLCETGGG